MCVAFVVKDPQGPTLAELKLMEEDNPHGAGLAWVFNKQVHYRKGITAQRIFQLLPQLPRPVIGHFRWATHGSKRPQLTHPFPLGRAALESKRLKGRAKAVLIHNGTWDKYLHYIPERFKGQDLSDTQVAAYVAAFSPEILDEVHWCTAVMQTNDVGNSEIIMRGSWDTHEGNLYSNLNWMAGNSHRWYTDGYYSQSETKPYESYSDYFSRKFGTNETTADEVLTPLVKDEPEYKTEYSLEALMAELEEDNDPMVHLTAKPKDKSYAELKGWDWMDD